MARFKLYNLCKIILLPAKRKMIYYLQNVKLYYYLQNIKLYITWKMMRAKIILLPAK